MSDHEFENYLTLISRFLRLSPAQREAIGEELRDHFESRLSELIDAGKSRHEAVRLALAEFGDAAGLAAEFTHISIARRRRLVMRCTVASVAALAAAVLVAMAVWPENRAGHGARNALAENAIKSPEKSGAAAIPTEDSLTAETEEKLEQFMSVEVADMPLTEYFTILGDQLKIQVFFDNSALRDASIDLSATPIGLALKNVRGRTLLNLILGQHNLGYVVRDGILIISTTDKLNTMLVTRIYDCREILAADRLENRPWDAVKAVVKSDEQSMKKEHADSSNVKNPAPNAAALKHSITGTPAEKLISVITTVVAAPTWDDVGGPGSIQEYNGLLVVSNTSDTQAQVSDLLRQVAGKLAAAKK